MKTIIVYASEYGTTETCAKRLAGQLPEGADLFNLSGGGAVALDEYDTVVVGGSVRVGKLLKPVREFCAARQAELLQKRLGLFICCGTPADAPQMLEANYPQALRRHAADVRSLGGELLQEKMKFFTRKLIAALFKSTGAEPPQIDDEAIAAMAKALGGDS